MHTPVTSLMSISDVGRAVGPEGTANGTMSSSVDPIGSALAMKALEVGTQSMKAQYGAFQRALDTRA